MCVIAQGIHRQPNKEVVVKVMHGELSASRLETLYSFMFFYILSLFCSDVLMNCVKFLHWSNVSLTVLLDEVRDTNAYVCMAGVISTFSSGLLLSKGARGRKTHCPSNITDRSVIRT